MRVSQVGRGPDRIGARQAWKMIRPPVRARRVGRGTPAGHRDSPLSTAMTSEVSSVVDMATPTRLCAGRGLNRQPLAALPA